MSEVKLLHGDCLDLMQSIPDKSVDMILCDPPYQLTVNSWDSMIPLDLLWQAYNRIAKDTCPIVLFCKQPFTTALISSNMINYRYNLIWRKNLKTNFLNARKMPMGAYEDIAVFYLNPPTYNPQQIPRTFQRMSSNKFNSTSSNYGKSATLWIDRQSDMIMPDDVIDYEDIPEDMLDLSAEMLYFECVHNSSGKYHPTQKPVALLEWLIRTYSNEGDTIMDNCMGSGSTGVACVNTNRDFIGIELDESYCEIAKQRIAAAKQGASPKFSKSTEKNKSLF